MTLFLFCRMVGPGRGGQKLYVTEPFLDAVLAATEREEVLPLWSVLICW